MKLLGLDSSAISASCAVVEDGCILAYGFVNRKITHSQTLMPLVGNTLKSAELTLNDIDGFAVSHGPGSFTGLRISVSAVKGMAFALNKPVCGVSTLLSLACNVIGTGAPSEERQSKIVCAVMDARRNEVYNALFRVNGRELTRMSTDRAISVDILKDELAQYNNVILVGDGAQLAYNTLFREESPDQVRIANAGSAWQSAASVCMAARNLEFVSAKELMPVYIRLPQAEREANKSGGVGGFAAEQSA
jgi:tRNA threonylcarbamoyladenosine biosynthesis protein TsaB